MPKHYVDRLQFLDHLIRTKATGSPKQLAKKLGISERRLFEYLECLKEMGAPLCYDKHLGCYQYEFDGEFIFKFKPRI